MRARVNALIATCALIATQAPTSLAAADDVIEPSEGIARRWIPSFALMGGATAQNVSGSQRSQLFDEGAPPVELRESVNGGDRIVNALVGASIDLQTPELPIPGRPRLFVSGEYLPAFGPERRVAQEGEPSRIRGPDVGAVLAVNETPTRYTNDPSVEPGLGRLPAFAFPDEEANGDGQDTITSYDRDMFGAKAGLAFPVEFMGRRFWLRPSVGWIVYEVEVEGILVDPSCSPSGSSTQCTNTYLSGDLVNEGFLRESILKGSQTEVFHGIGPGLDVEMYVGRFGAVATTLFIGGQAYYIPGSREVEARAGEAYDDLLGQDLHTATWRARVAPWFVRGNLGIRFQWLGSAR